MIDIIRSCVTRAANVLSVGKAISHTVMSSFTLKWFLSGQISKLGFLPKSFNLQPSSALAGFKIPESRASVHLLI